MYIELKTPLKNNKGFTLVELVVVLVILAILAAILTPALLGYIDEAKRKQEIIDAKALRTAIQSELSLEFAKNGSNYFSSFDDSNDIFLTDSVDAANNNKEFVDAIFEKSGVDPNPFLLIFYTLKVNGTDYDSSAESDKHGAYTCLSVLYWKDKDLKPIFYDFVNGEWKEGSLYSEDIVKRGTNMVQNGLYKDRSLRVCIVTTTSRHTGNKTNKITAYNNMTLKVMNYKGSLNRNNYNSNIDIK